MIMASGPITSWQIVGVNSGSWWWTGRPGVLQFMGSQESDTTEWLIWSDLSDRFPVLGLQNHCGWWLQPWNQKMTASWLNSDDKPRQGVKSRDSTLQTKVCIVKAMVFAVVMFGCEKWNIKKAECQRIDAFKLWCWGRLLKVSWTTRRSKQSILNEIILEYSWKWCWSWNSSILVIWCEQTTHWKSPWCWERSRVEEEEGVRGWVGWMASSV